MLCMKSEGGVEELDLSIVIPVCHGGRFLGELLQSALHLDFPPESFEFLVAVNADDVQSRNMIERISAAAPFRVLRVPCASSNKAHRLNIACARARGRILAFADDDCVLPADWLERIAGVVEGEKNVGAVGGRDCSRATSSFDLALDWVLNSFVGTGGCRFGGGGWTGRFYPRLWNMAVPREIALAVSYLREDGSREVFDESLAVHEDVELMERIDRLGKRILYSPDLQVSHHRDTTYFSFLSRNFHMARICRREGVHRFAQRVLAAAVVGVGVLAAAAAVWHPARKVLAAAAGFYAALLIFSAAAAAFAKRSPEAGVWVPAMLLGVHFARGVGYVLPSSRSVREA
jgi:GT2 family glycosyltransferase